MQARVVQIDSLPSTSLRVDYDILYADDLSLRNSMYIVYEEIIRKLTIVGNDPGTFVKIPPCVRWVSLRANMYTTSCCLACTVYGTRQSEW